jgi:hypothetical protein
MFNNKKLIIFLLLILLMIVGIGVFLYNGHVYNQEMSKKCIGYNPDWTLLDDCFGVISISHGFDTNGYLMTDHAHGNYILAAIDKLSDYRFSNGKVFVINRVPIECSVIDKNNKKQFCQNLYQNKKSVTNYFDKQSDIPIYLAIETQTGEVTTFQSLDKVPKNEKSIFMELEKNKN